MIADFYRTLGYTRTREQIDPDRIGYLGISYGAALGPFLVGANEGLQTMVLLGTGREGMIATNVLEEGRWQISADGARRRGR